LRRVEVLVIGGGPAGATAALLLARGGRQVALLEQSRFPRRKVCGEFIAPPAAALLRSLGARLEPEIGRVELWAGERVLRARLPAPCASAMAREDLDAFLLRRAAEAGTAVYQPEKALSIDRFKDQYICETSSTPIQAAVVIAAHGTPQRRAAPRPSDLLAFKAHFRGATVPGDLIALLPFAGGYGGALHLGDGRATFACCIRRDALEALRRAGEPAGEVQPVVGLGISLAMRSAALLSRTLDTPAVYARECRKLYARALLPSALIAHLMPHARAPWMLTLGARLAAPSPAWPAACAARRAAPRRP